MTQGQKPDRLLQLLGICMRARQLVSGEEQVLKAIQQSKANLVFIGSDISPLTKKKLTDKGLFYEIPTTEAYTAAQLTQAIGLHRATIAVMDAGFAKKMITLLG